PALIDALRARAPIVVSAHGYPACTSGVYYFRPGQECTRGHGPGCVPNLILRGCAHLRNPLPLPSLYANATRGLHTLSRAALVVDAEFVLCGDGGELASMQRLARRYSLQQRVRFTGWLSADDLAEELAQASIVALPSVWPEPFGIVGIEGFAAGRPAVAT